jgi:protein ImuB
LAPGPLALDPASLDPLGLGTLVDRLANRVGSDRVYRIELVESDVPERSVRKAHPLSQGLVPHGLAAKKQARTGRRAAPAWPADLPRPVRLLDPPQAVETLAALPDSPPVMFTWRRVRHHVRRADGPERIAGEWWKREGERHAVRDYYRVEDESGRRFWLFRKGNGNAGETGDMRWFLHGFL